MTERDTCHMLRTVMFGTLASLAISTAAQAQNSPDEATRIAQSAVVSYLAAFGQHDAKPVFAVMRHTAEISVIFQ
jgi:hypothetical protein